MIATASTSPPQVSPTPGPMVRRLGYGIVRFTVADTRSMLQQGIIPEDSTVELLDGSLMYRDRFDLRGDEIVEGLGHNFVVSALAQLAPRIDSDLRHLRTQGTLICAEDYAPIPDGIVLRGPIRNYRDHIPTGNEVFSLIEVADSSYERDSGIKLAGYAGAGIQQYIIINLRNHTAEVYTNPDRTAGTYSTPLVLDSTQSLDLRIGEAEYFAVSLAELLV